MPEPVRSGQRYMPGLDGLRALAVLAVIAYHEQFGWAPGGMLGVGVFFTLSGYLITDLLLGQWAAHGGLNLGDFWLRRARRLLPALFVMLAVVTAWVTVAEPVPAGQPARRGGRGRDLFEQLVLHRYAQLVLRQVRAAWPVRSPLVAGRGGAVLPGLALAAAARRVPACAAGGRRRGALAGAAHPGCWPLRRPSRC